MISLQNTTQQKQGRKKGEGENDIWTICNLLYISQKPLRVIVKGIHFSKSFP